MISGDDLNEGQFWVCEKCNCSVSIGIEHCNYCDDDEDYEENLAKENKQEIVMLKELEYLDEKFKIEELGHSGLPFSNLIGAYWPDIKAYIDTVEKEISNIGLDIFSKETAEKLNEIRKRLGAM